MNRRGFWGAAVLAGACAAAALLVVAWSGREYLLPSRLDMAAIERYYRALPVTAAAPVDAETVREGILAATGYIQRATDEAGRLVYAVNTNPAVPPVAEYSMLRHAGTIYALGMAQAVSPDPKTVAAMQRATEFMRRCCLARLDRPAGAVGLWEPPGLGLTTTRLPEYKLGGAGLGLAALVSLETVSPGAVLAEEMRGLARFGQFLQRWNGEFDAKFVPGGAGRTQEGWVMFYPGEMVLGWLMLYERDPASRDLFDSAVAALSHVARERAIAGAAPADHWALLATARLFRLAERDRLAVPRELLLDHALQVCHTMLEAAYGPVPLPAMEGTLVTGGRGEVTPTATRLEALLAALEFLPPSHPITPHVTSAVHRGTGFVLRAQVQSGPFDGGIPLAISALPVDGSVAAAKFNAQVGEIRIDYVQHALSAMVQYWRLRPGTSASKS
jgi:hypothetical protein